MNEIKHLFCLNFLTLSFLFCFDCAISPFLGSGRGVPKRRYWGYSGVFWGVGAKFPIRPSWLINRLSHWLLRQQLDLTNSPGTDSYPFVSYCSGEAPSEGFATLRNVPELRSRVWAILSARAQVSRAKGDVNTWQMLLGVWVRLELTEPLWWRCNNLSQANPPFNGYQKVTRECHAKGDAGTRCGERKWELIRMFACHLK